MDEQEDDDTQHQGENGTTASHFAAQGRRQTQDRKQSNHLVNNPTPGRRTQMPMQSNEMANIVIAGTGRRTHRLDRSHDVARV